MKYLDPLVSRVLFVLDLFVRDLSFRVALDLLGVLGPAESCPRQFFQAPRVDANSPDGSTYLEFLAHCGTAMGFANNPGRSLEHF